MRRTNLLKRHFNQLHLSDTTNEKAPTCEGSGLSDNYRYLRRFATSKPIWRVKPPVSESTQESALFRRLTFFWANESALCEKV
jgi:hypothetical protein